MDTESEQGHLTYKLLLCWVNNDPQGTVDALDGLTDDDTDSAILLAVLASTAVITMPSPHPGRPVVPQVVDQYGNSAPEGVYEWTVARLVAAAAADDVDTLEALSRATVAGDDYADVVSDLVQMAARACIETGMIPMPSGRN